MIMWETIKPAPKDGKEIVIWDDNEYLIVEWRADKNKWYSRVYDDFLDIDAPYWISLPEPPQE